MKKNTLILIALILTCIPLVLFDLFTIEVSHISYPCSFFDFKCLISHHSYDGIIANIKGLIIIIILNLLILIPVFIYIKKIVQELNKKNIGGSK